MSDLDQRIAAATERLEAEMMDLHDAAIIGGATVEHDGPVTIITLPRLCLRDYVPLTLERMARGLDDPEAWVALDTDEDGGWVPIIATRGRLRVPLTTVSCTVRIK